jgi:polar amino acid transport system substrate-binding protein
MLDSRRSLIFVCALLAAFLMSERTARAECALVVGWEPYVPYQFEGEDGIVTGADIELMREIGAAIDCTLKFRKMPWARHLSQLRNGTVDVAMSASWTEERNTYVRFSEPYRQSEMAIFVRQGTAAKYPLGALADIPAVDFRLGVISGYYYGEEFEDLQRNAAFAAAIDPASDYPTNIQKLLHGRIDGVLSDDFAVMFAEANALNAREKIERHPLVLSGDQFHIMFSRQSVPEEIVAASDRQLLAMKADGRLQTILQAFVE